MTTIGIAQFAAGPLSPEDGRARSLAAAAALAEREAELLVLPELAAPGYTVDPRALEEAAEPVDGPTVTAWQGFAARTGTTIVAGFCERGPGRPYNSVVLVSGAGVGLHYRKLHLFAAEKEVFAPGDLGLPVGDTPFGRIGLCVCYDLRFVEVMRTLALRDAELICVPSAWIGGFDTLADPREAGCAQSDGAQLQANLNQVFVACSSYGATDAEPGFLGSSLLVDPTGDALVGPMGRAEVGLATYDIDLTDARLAQDRGNGVTPRLDRRTDVYRLAYEGQEL